MKKSLFILILIFGFVQLTKADTTDFWHVYYNKKEIREYGQFGIPQTIILKIDSIHSGDSITVKYFHDGLCFDCQTFLVVEDKYHKFVLMSGGKGTFNPVSFALKDLLVFKNDNHESTFDVYYSEDSGSHSRRILLFRIKLE
jgi:hypothetical protein